MALATTSQYTSEEVQTTVRRNSTGTVSVSVGDERRLVMSVHLVLKEEEARELMEKLKEVLS